MTDKEIIQALECCKPNNDEGCLNCPFDKYSLPECAERLSKESVALINRQQAEIDNYSHNIKQLTEENFQLQAEIEMLEIRLKKERHQFEDVAKMYDVIKAEAIKEFAEELRFRLSSGTWKHKNVLLDDCKWIIDNLVKEMVGDDK